ncbi:MAG: peptidoglycan-binding protein [Planctomycetota bacterium]
MFAVALTALAIPAPLVIAADFTFFGRSGDAIELDFASQPGVTAGSSFTGFQINPAGFASNTALTADQLGGSAFSAAGQAYLFADPDPFPQFTPDLDADERGYQGTVTGSVQINGQTKTFAVEVRPGYSGVGRGAVGQSLEGLGRSNNPLFVAQQQHRLAYFGYQAEGGGLPGVTGTFDADTDDALRTFQAAFVGGLNTTQANVDGIIGPITAGWLNAGNAPFWERLDTNANISSVSSFEPYATSWTLDLVRAATADAKADTGVNQRITALSTDDGYGSSAIHSTHRAGMDIDLGIPLEARNTGSGFLNPGEATAADFARAFIDAHRNHPELDVRVSRILNSNIDIIGEVNRTHPGVMVNDTGGSHASHFHIDVTPLGQDAPNANLLGDFDLSDDIDQSDIDWLYRNQGGDGDVFSIDGNNTVTLTDVAVLVTDILGTVFGDANLDQTIDQADLNAVLNHWGQSYNGWATGDFTGDRVVDQADLNAVLNQWGVNTAPDLAALPVPEPATALAFSLLAVGMKRRR